MKKLTKTQLERKVLELESQLAHRYHFASSQISGAAIRKRMASGVMLQLTAIGGEQIIPPVTIKDGLSEETIDALKKDLLRSFELAIAFKP